MTRILTSQRHLLPLAGLFLLLPCGCSQPTAPIRLSPPTSANLVDVSPAWSPTADSIAYSRVVPSGDGPPGIYIVSVNGGRARLVSQNIVHHLRFSPDGRQLAGTLSGQIAVLDVATGQLMQITSTDNLAIQPDWSPDGRWLVYHRVFLDPGEDPDSAGLYLYDRVQGTHSPLKHNGIPTYGRWTRWSPDGAQIAFMYAGRIHVVYPDGQGFRQITRPLPGYLHDYPQWLCTSGQILFEQSGGAQPELRLFDLTAGTAERWSIYFGPTSALSASCEEVVVGEVDEADSARSVVLFIRNARTGSLVRQLTRYSPQRPTSVPLRPAGHEDATIDRRSLHVTVRPG